MQKKKRTYKQCLAEAKSIARLLRLTNEHRIKIAKIAEEVAEIQHGGKAKATRYTLKKFGEDININPHTLYEWIRTKNYIYEKVDAANKAEYIRMSADQIKRFMVSIKDTTPAATVNKKFKAYVLKGPEHNKFYKYIKVMDTIIYNLSSVSNMANIEENLIDQCIKKAKQVEILARRARDIKSGKIIKEDKKRKITKDFWAEEMQL